MCGAAATLALCMVPASAFAEVVDGTPVYKLPDKPMAIQQQATDDAGNTYTVDTLSVCAAQPPMQMPYYSLLGINNTMAGRASASVPTGSAQYGLFGSDANVSPDPYLYNYCASLNGATVAADAMINASSTMAVTINGTEYNMPRDVYMETTLIQSTADTKSGDYTYTEWVALENQRTNRTKTTVYNPTFIKLALQNGGTYKLTESLYAIADQADTIIASNTDANGNYIYNTRYADGANTWEVASKYEDIVKGSQYYLLSQLEDGAIAEKATVAVVCGYDTETGNYAVRKLDIGNGDVDSNYYAGRIAGAVCTIANDMNDLGLEPQQEAYVGTVTTFGQETTLDESEYLAWYSADQIIENCDAVLITDAYEGNAQRYLAHSSNGSQPTVYTNTANLIDAQAAARAEGKTAADICVNWPQSLFGCYYAQGCENVMLTLVSECFLYPQTFDLTDMMAWWAKNVWHITDASLQDMVDTTCYNVSLSSNQSKIGTISSDFEQQIDWMINAGNNYYLENMDAIDAMNEGNIKTHSVAYLVARTSESVSASTSKVKEGKMASISVDDPIDNASYKWQWSKDGVTWKTCTFKTKNESTLKLYAYDYRADYKYRCVVTTEDGDELVTNAVSLDIVDVTATAGETVSGQLTEFTCTTDIENPTYQWQYRKSSTGSWKNITSAKTKNSDVLKLYYYNYRANYQYRCKVTDADGQTFYSNAVTWNL